MLSEDEQQHLTEYKAYRARIFDEPDWFDQGDKCNVTPLEAKGNIMKVLDGLISGLESKT